MEIKNNQIAHRGVFNNKNYPENSLKAFEKALSLDFPIELDVQLTKDNILIVFHDSNLKRMTGIDKNVCDSTYQEIKELFLLDTKEKIPALKEVLDLVQNKVLLDIEIKNTKKIEKICTILMKELEGYHNFILKSFNPKIVRYLKTNYPDTEVGYLIDEAKNKHNSFLASYFMIHYSKANFLAINKNLLAKKKFQKLKEKYPIFVWTIKKGDIISNQEYILIRNDLIS